MYESRRVTIPGDRVYVYFLTSNIFELTDNIATIEGLETCFFLSYYSGLRLVSNLLPLLQKSPRPRVLSILNGTNEKRVNDEYIGRRWHQQSIVSVIDHSTTYTSLAFDYLATNDTQKKITFVDTTPGLAYTGTPNKRGPPMDDGLLWWAFISMVQKLRGLIIP
jgi:hypothetical protein